jgi:hypothetical protein
MMIVGEQPGDQENRAGRPFVGPAGKLLQAALDEAGIDRGEAYVTNAVKHFKARDAGKSGVCTRRLARASGGLPFGGWTRSGGLPFGGWTRNGGSSGRAW